VAAYRDCDGLRLYRLITENLHVINCSFPQASVYAVLKSDAVEIFSPRSHETWLATAIENRFFRRSTI